MEVPPQPREARLYPTTGLAADFRCVGCDYNLRALTGDRCPECGRSLGALCTGISENPWVSRGGRGPLRAWWATLWWITRHPRNLADEVLLTLDERAADRFHHLTTALTWLPWMVAAVIAGRKWMADRFRGDSDGLLIASVAWATAIVCLLPLIHAMQTFITAHYRSDAMPRDRAACYRSIARYAGAVRFWLILGIPLLLAGVYIPGRFAEWSSACLIFAALSPFPLMAWLEAILAIPAYRLAGPKAYRRAAFLSFSLSWPLVMLAALVIIPGVAAYFTGLVVLLFD